jgi:anti-sigma factor RsiW
MNVDFGSHVSPDALELYALGMLSDRCCATLEEHLLVCPRCQIHLEAADTYISLVRSAYVLISSRSQGFPRARAMQVAESL